MAVERIQCLAERDEVAGDEPRTLVNELIEGVLAVGTGLTPVNGPRLIPGLSAVQRYVLAVALHRQLLEISREPLQVLIVRQHRNRFRAQKIVVPDREESHEDRQVSFERRGAEMLVH